jgi:hypothetical protein
MAKRKETKICRYCGKEYRGQSTKDVCSGCYEKVPLLPRFKAARDALRRKTGLPKM